MMSNNNQQPLNLLDLVLPATTADTNIHTFMQFKEWINTSFQIKTHLNVGNVGSSIINKPINRKIRPAKSLTGDRITPSNVVILSSVVKRVPTISYNMLDEIQQGMMEQSHMTKSIRSRKYSNYNDQLGIQLKENSNFGSKSAHSSRSFRGYQQINQYQLRKKIGKGSFAEVFLAYDTQTDIKYAVKVLQTKQIKKKLLLKKNTQIIDSPNEQDQQQHEIKSILNNKESLAGLFIRNQVAILKKMNHQYITKLQDVIVDNENNKVYLVLQHCGGGFINQSKEEGILYKKLLESQCKRYFKQLCLAIDYIHNVAKISHRDIKPENILLNSNDQIKLSDFGLGTHKLKGAKQSGTPLYMPPISNEQQDVSNQSHDIWALGVTLLVLLTGKTPQFNNNKIDKQKILSSLKQISDNCKDFITRCLELDANKRMKAQQMLTHSWLNLNNEILTKQTSNMKIEISAADQLNIFTSIQVKKEAKQKQQSEQSFKFTLNI